MADRVLILGASARAAAASARRAGLTPFAIDLFADRDTAELCEYVLRVPLADYPRGLFEAARKLPPMPWFYTGGLENYPDLVGELAAERELWGNGPDVLRRVRNPHHLARLSASGVAGFVPPTPPGEGTVRKPLRGAGGVGVRPYQPGDAAHADFYHQRQIAGPAFSAVYAATPNRLSVLGTSAQLVGCSWLHADNFRYAGSLTRAWPCGQLNQWAHELCQTTGMRGLFGLDTVGGLDVVDVNPRYVSSVEVHEYATGGRLLSRTQPPLPATRAVGKAIYYAARQLTFPDSGPWDDSVRHCTDVWRCPDFADIPRPGEVIEPGQPVVTILAHAPIEATVLATLKSWAAALDRLFGVPTPKDDSP